MADPRTAITLTLENEDRGLTGRITTDNNGFKVKYGINAQDNPDLWDANHPDGPSLDEAILRYTSVYWPMSMAQLTSQHVADMIFDLGVNMGRYHAAQILQRAISRLGVTVTIDGVIGAATVASANTCNEAQLVAAIVAEADAYYELLAAVKLEDAPYLKEWLARVKTESMQVDTGLTAE